MKETQAQRIKRMRKALGWNQQELARQADCSQGSVGNLEGTKARGYSLETITKIANALGTTVDYLELKDGSTFHPIKEVQTHSFMGEQLARTFDDLPDDRILRNKAYIAASQVLISFLPKNDDPAMLAPELLAKSATQS